MSSTTNLIRVMPAEESHKIFVNALLRRSEEVFYYVSWAARADLCERCA